MLSICIPIYNYDCTGLVASLLRQLDDVESKVEIIVIDDGSESSFQELFKQFSPLVRFIQLKENIGRSRIRNLLAEKASYEYLLFIDGDSSIIKKDFISRYVEELKKDNKPDVICGGSIYADEAPSKNQMLRWKYSKTRERKSLYFSKRNPYQSFTTNNFIINKEVFLTIKFDERIEDYGHEDTFFGFELKKRKVTIQHLDNVVLNGDLDENELYLSKSQESVSNLLKIAEYLNYDNEFIKMIPLLKVYFRIKIVGLEIFLRWWFKMNRKRLERKFINGEVNLFFFDLYRLGTLAVLFRKA